jgi:hypothetical protein
MHAGSWVFLLLLFFLSFYYNKQKISLMLTRLFYVIMIVSGIGMLHLVGYSAQYVVKGLFAIALIAIMESIVVRKRKGKALKTFWIMFAIFLPIVLIIGYTI